MRLSVLHESEPKRLPTRIERELMQFIYKGEERRRAAEAAANTDELTGLYNQRAFRAGLRRVEADPNTYILVADLKKFKALNDALGQEAGDQALKIAAQAFSDLATKNDIAPRGCFRSGIGDEFGAFGPLEKLEQLAAALNNYNSDFHGYPLAFRANIGKTYAQAGKVKV